MSGVLIYTGLVVTTVLGCLYHIDGARNLAMFAVWILSPMMVLSSTDEAVTKQSRKPKSAWTWLRGKWMWMCVLTTLGILAWAGAFWTATVWGLTLCVAASFQHRVTLARAAQHTEGTGEA